MDSTTSTLEYQIIKSTRSKRQKVTVLLTTDGNEDPFSLFRKPSEVLTHLKEIAKDLNIELQQQFLNNNIVLTIKI